MNLISEMAEAPPSTKRCNLLLHCGAHAVPVEEVPRVPTPRPSRTWHPIPHHELLSLLLYRLRVGGLRVLGHAHALTHDGQRYFGLLEVGHGDSQEAARVIGIRNSHDKRLSAGLVAGSQVLVCDNLSFSGEIALARKHTPRILDDLPGLLDRGISRLQGFWRDHEKRILRYRGCPITDWMAHDLFIRAVDRGVLAMSGLREVVDHWREPRYECFRPRNLWSLQNAFTEGLKGAVHRLPDRSLGLHQLLDEYCDRLVASGEGGTHDYSQN